MSEDPDDRIWGRELDGAPNSLHSGTTRRNPWEPQCPERPGEPMACSTPGQDQDLLSQEVGSHRPPPGTWDTRLFDFDHIISQSLSPDRTFDQESTLSDQHLTINQTIDQLLSQSECLNEPIHGEEGAYSLPLSRQLQNLREGTQDQGPAQENIQTRNYTEHDLQVQAMLQFSQGLQNQHQFQTHLQHRNSGESNQPSANVIQSCEGSQNTRHSSQYNPGGLQPYQNSQNKDRPHPNHQSAMQTYQDLDNITRPDQQNQNIIAQDGRQPPAAILPPQLQLSLPQAPHHLPNAGHIYKLAQDIAQANDQQPQAAPNMAQMHQQPQSIPQTFQLPYSFVQPFQQQPNIVGTHQQPQNITSQSQQNIVSPNQQAQIMPLISQQPQSIAVVSRDHHNSPQTSQQAQNVMLPSQHFHTDISLPPPYQDPSHRNVSQTFNFPQSRQPDVHISPLVPPHQVQNFVVLCQPGQPPCPPPLPPLPPLQGLVLFPQPPQLLGMPFAGGQSVALASASNPPTVSEQGQSHTEATPGKPLPQRDQNFSVFQMQGQSEIQTVMKHQLPSQNLDPNQARPENSEIKHFNPGNPVLNQIFPDNSQLNQIFLENRDGNKIYSENRDLNPSNAQNALQNDTEKGLSNQSHTNKSETKDIASEDCVSTEVCSQSKQRSTGNQPRIRDQSAHRAHARNRTTTQGSSQSKTPPQNPTKGHKHTKTQSSIQPLQQSHIPVQNGPQSGPAPSSLPANDPMNQNYQHNLYLSMSNPSIRHRGQSRISSHIPVRTQPQSRMQVPPRPSHQQRSQNTPIYQTKNQVNPQGQIVEQERHQMHRPGQAYQNIPQKDHNIQKKQHTGQAYAQQNRNVKNPRRQTFDPQAKPYQYMNPQNPFHQNIHPQAFQQQSLNTQSQHYRHTGIQNICHQGTNAPAPQYHAQGPYHEIMNPKPSCHQKVSGQNQYHQNVETKLSHHQGMGAQVPYHQNMNVHASHHPDTNMPSSNQQNIYAQAPYHPRLNLPLPNLQNTNVQVPNNQNKHPQTPFHQNVNMQPANNQKTDAQTEHHQNINAQVPSNQNADIRTPKSQNAFGLNSETKIQDWLSSANQLTQKTDLLGRSPEKKCRISEVSSEQLSIGVNHVPSDVPSNQHSGNQDAEASSEQLPSENRDFKVGIWLDSPPFQRSRSCSKPRSGSQKRGGQRKRSQSTKGKAESRVTKVEQGSGNTKSAKDNSKAEESLEPCKRVGSVENENLIRDSSKLTGGSYVYTNSNRSRYKGAVRSLSLARQPGGQNTKMTNIQSPKAQSNKKITSKDRSEPWQQIRYGQKMSPVYSKKSPSTYRTNVVEDQGRCLQRDSWFEKKWYDKSPDNIRQERKIIRRRDDRDEKCEEEKDKEGDGGEKNKEREGRHDRKDDGVGGNGGGRDSGGGEQGGGEGNQGGGREDNRRGRRDGGRRERGGEGKDGYERERRDGRGDDDVKCKEGGKSEREGKEKEEGKRESQRGEEKKEDKNEWGATNRGREERDVGAESGTPVNPQSGAEGEVGVTQQGEIQGLPNSGAQGPLQYWTGDSVRDGPQHETGGAGTHRGLHGEAQNRSPGKQGRSHQVRVEVSLSGGPQAGSKNGIQPHQSIDTNDLLQGRAESSIAECGGEQGNRPGGAEEGKLQGLAEGEVTSLTQTGTHDGPQGAAQDSPIDGLHGRSSYETQGERFQGGAEFKIQDWPPSGAECSGAQSKEQGNRPGGAEVNKSHGLTEGEVSSLAPGGKQDGPQGAAQNNPIDGAHGRSSYETQRSQGGAECGGAQGGGQGNRPGGAEDKLHGQVEGEVTSSALTGRQDRLHRAAQDNPTDGLHGRSSNEAQGEGLQGGAQFKIQDWPLGGAECGGAQSKEQGNRTGGAEVNKSHGLAEGEVSSLASGGIQYGPQGAAHNSPKDGVHARSSDKAQRDQEGGIEEEVHRGAEDEPQSSQVRPTYREPSEMYSFTVPRLTDGTEEIEQAKVMWAAYAPADLLYAVKVDINEQWRTPPRYTPFMLQFPLTEEQRQKRRRQKMLAYVSHHEYLVQEHSGVLRDERARQLFSSLEQDRARRLHTDLMVKVDQCEFHAHSLVLHSLSSFFRDLLQDPDCPAEGTETKLTTVDVGNEACTPQIFSIIMDFAYTGHLRLTLENVHEVVQAVDEFGLDRKAKDICENFMLYHLDDLTVCRFLSLSHTYLYPTLKHEACRYLGRQLIRLMSSADFLELEPDLLQELLERDDLVVCDIWYGSVWIPMDTPDREATILKAVLCYLSRNYSEDLAICRQLLQTVRFPDINDIELVKMINVFQRMSKNVVLQGLVDLRDKLARGEINIYETRQLVPSPWRRRRVLAKWFWECMGVPGLKLDSGIGRSVCPWPIEVPTMEICNIIVHVSQMSEGETSVIAGLELVYRDIISKQGVLCVGAGCRSSQWWSILICLEPDEYIETVQTAVQDFVLRNLILITSYGRRYGPFGHCPKSVPMYENRPMDVRLRRLHGLGCQTDTVNGTEAVTSLELYWTCFL